jgi:hypothetical protein
MEHSVRAAILSVYPGAAITRMEPMTDVMAESVGAPRFYLALIGTFAGHAGVGGGRRDGVGHPGSARDARRSSHRDTNGVVKRERRKEKGETRSPEASVTIG